MAVERIYIRNTGEARVDDASIDKVEAILRAEGAKLWINHDAAQTDSLPLAPRWIA